MKKLLITGIIASSSFAMSWSTISGMFKSTVDSISYTISASGYNPRVYEFDTQGLPKLHCIVVFRSHSGSAPAMQCVPTTPNDIKLNKKINN